MTTAVRCRVDGCARPSYALGCCQAHYFRLRRTGNVHSGVALRPQPAPIDAVAVWDLRFDGASEREIAAVLGVSRSGVNAVLRGLHQSDTRGPLAPTAADIAIERRP